MSYISDVRILKESGYSQKLGYFQRKHNNVIFDISPITKTDLYNLRIRRAGRGGFRILMFQKIEHAIDYVNRVIERMEV